VVNELGSKVNPFTDRVEVNRKPVKLAPKGVMLLNKPRGVVSTLSDPEGRPTIADFLTKHYRSYFPVGRLDWDSTGLMLLTNDGELAELLMHPRYQFDRVYHARVEGSVSEELLKKFEKGIKLRDGVAYGVARIVGNNDATTWVEIRVREGRNRLVRRMFDEIGHSVVKLKRVEYGPFRLGKLDVGEVRPLTEKEYVQVRRKVFSEVSAPKVELNTQSISKAKEIRKRSKKKGRTRLE
jgi:pseudouridine synthase